MSFTYSGLKTAVQNYIDSSETTFVNTLDTFIQQAENRIFNTIELNVFRKNVRVQRPLEINICLHQRILFLL